jgi:DNA repair protein RadC
MLISQQQASRSLLRETETKTGPQNGPEAHDAPAEAPALVAVPAVGCDRSIRITTAAEAAAFLVPVFAGVEVEELHVIMLDARHMVMRREMIARGSLTGVDAHPREVFVPAVRHRACAILIAHNHPSGNPAPSAADIELTERLIDAGEILGIPLLDHLIVGAGGTYRSLQADGRIRRSSRL